MADTLFSPSWYRVADLKPRIRQHIQIHRHVYRGRIWFILQDHVGGRSHRFTPAAYRFIGMMDGQKSVETLWQVMNAETGDEAPTQDEVIRLLGQLHSADALICDTTPDSLEVFRRHERLDRMKLKQKLWTPLVVRIPLIDPERFLERTFPYVKWLFSRFGMFLWLAVVVTGAVFAGINWSALTENLVDQVLAPENLIALWLVYPFVKTLHELGHGYAIKKSGGEVHEIGLMFLVLVPVPFVDASASSGFRSKYQRMLVGAAGIMVELFLGSLALFVWLNVQPGLVHTLAYNVMLISGVSTLFFNGNPLLRFDGYYVLQDAVEIPNLGTRANKYLGYLMQRYGFGINDAESPADSSGEKVWFIIYGIAAFFYRMFIMAAIIFYISTRFFVVGVILALWAIFTMAIVPMGKGLNFLVSNPRLRHQRGRSASVSFLLVIALLAFLFFLPIPHWTRVQGVTWPAERSQIRANVDGVILRLAASSGSEVHRDQLLLEAADPFVEAKMRVLIANKKELDSQLLDAQINDQVQSGIISEAITAVNASIRLTQEKIDSLEIRSSRAGTLVVPGEKDLPGRYMRQGQIIAYVINPDDQVTVRAVVTQDDIGLIRESTKKISIRPSQWRGKPVDAQILREVPGGTQRLASAALGVKGGGSIIVDPRDPDGRQTLQRVFEIEIGLPEGTNINLFGARMHVRFDHGYKPAGYQLYMALRQLFLRTFGV